MSNKNDCVYIMSHGKYSDNEKYITIPDNIRLIQYALPKRKINKFRILYYI